MRLFGYPSVPLAKLVDWTADWVGARHAEPRQGHPLRYPRWQVLSTSLAVEAALSPAEMDDAGALVREAGWNQTAADWRIFLELGPRLRVRRRAHGRIVATAATLPFGGRFAWISMVLVARRLSPPRACDAADAPRCIDDLAAAGLVPVLDATPDGRAVYRALGFEDRGASSG